MMRKTMAMVVAMEGPVEEEVEEEVVVVAMVAVVVGVVVVRVLRNGRELLHTLQSQMPPSQPIVPPSSPLSTHHHRATCVLEDAECLGMCRLRFVSLLHLAIPRRLRIAHLPLLFPYLLGAVRHLWVALSAMHMFHRCNTLHLVR